MIMPRNALAFIIIHQQISKPVTAKIILVSPALRESRRYFSRKAGKWLNVLTGFACTVSETETNKKLEQRGKQCFMKNHIIWEGIDKWAQ